MCVEVCIRIFVLCVWGKGVGVGGVCMCGSFIFMFFVEYCLVFKMYSDAFSLCVGV